MTNPTTSSGIFDLNDFLPSYLYATRQLLHDAQGTYFQDSDLIAYINEARNHAVVDTGCLRTLIVPTLPGGIEKFAFGGVYQFNNKIPVPSGGLAPFKLVSGGGGAATATTSAVPMTVSINTGGAGEYFQTPIVTFDAPGMNISATAVAELGDVTTTGVTLYGTTTADGTLPTANELSETAGTHGPSTDANIDGDLTGFGELPAQGTAASWPSLGAIPDPDGYGFLWDLTILENTTLPPTTWTPSLELVRSTNNGTVTADVYVRIFKYNAGTYTQIVACKHAGVTLTNTPVAINSWSNNTSLALSFSTGDKLYVDVMLNITENTASTDVATNVLYYTPTASATLTSANELTIDVPLTAPTAETAVTSTDSGYGEIYSQGNASTWAAGASLPSPSGHGFLYDSTLLEGYTLPADAWSPILDLYIPGTIGGHSVTAYVYVRFYKFDGSSYTQIVACKSSAAVIIGGTPAVISSWVNNTGVSTAFSTGDKLYMDVILDITANSLSHPSGFAFTNNTANQNVTFFSTIVATETIGFVSAGQLQMFFDYQALGSRGLSSINVLSDAGDYNAASVVPAVNIVPVGQSALVQDDGTGYLKIVTQGAGQANGVYIEDANGTLTSIGAADVSILPKEIASVDNCTLIWNSQRMALRNMAFSDFSAALRAWVPYQNIPLAYSVYAESIYIGPIPNQAYQYELDCIIYPDPLTDYTAVGQISSRAAIAAVKYYAAYLAMMGQQQPQEAANFLALYAQKVAWAGNLYTTRLSQVYTDNANLE